MLSIFPIAVKATTAQAIIINTILVALPITLVITSFILLSIKR
nr:MAG TPA: hypothetical protein [Caudoviricetes sp.]